MVVFECGRCNETIKKPKLEKHLQMCQSEYVSCIDCGVRFRWDEWHSHTTCVSEAQKYQGHLFQAKDNQNKGKLKQDNWTEQIAQAIEDAAGTISPEIKGLCERLQGFDNIPRKQKPFTNFVKNSLKLWDEKKIGAIWEVISKAGKKPEASSTETPKAPEKWEGWKRALDTELLVAGGEMPWKKLRENVIERYHNLNKNNGVAEEKLQLQALTNIPEEYLSKEDDLVRLPKP